MAKTLNEDINKFRTLKFKNGETLTEENIKTFSRILYKLTFNSDVERKYNRKYSIAIVANNNANDWFGRVKSIPNDDAKNLSMSINIDVSLKNFIYYMLLGKRKGIRASDETPFAVALLAIQPASTKARLEPFFNCSTITELHNLLDDDERAETVKTLRGFAKNKFEAEEYFKNNIPKETIDWIKEHYISINALVPEKAQSDFIEVFEGSYSADKNLEPLANSGVRFFEGADTWGRSLSITFDTADKKEMPGFILGLENKEGHMIKLFPEKNQSKLDHNVFITALICYYDFRFGKK